MIRILVGDVRDRIRELESGSVQTVVTSPPYFGLRDYGHDGQMGLEPTPTEYVAGMVDLFREVRRVLRDDGTLWLNLGDSYAGSGKGANPDGTPHPANLSGKQGTNKGTVTGINVPQRAGAIGLKPKDLIGIPWRVAFALQADGWYLRQDIIWAKPNPMPESVRDRCTKSHEYIFLLAKSERYYFDAEAIAEPLSESSIERLSQETLADQRGSDRVPGKTNGRTKAVSKYHDDEGTVDPAHRTKDGLGGEKFASTLAASVARGTRNKRSVWTVTTKPFKGAHFATFPPDLIEPCILAGSPRECCAVCGAPVERVVERTPATVQSPASDYGDGAGRNDGGRSMLVGATSETIAYSPSCACGSGTKAATVLDPFGGAGTTGLVASRHGRAAILCELNPEYAAMARDRINDDSPLFPDASIEAAP